ncbi:LysR family transcriptional regulator [Streptomyces sp. NPDC002586]
MKHGADLGMLRTFLCVYRCGGVAKAAGLLGLSRPAVSRHLKTLEGATGRALFNRLGRGVAPTQAGDLLAAQIATHLDALEDAVDTLVPSSTTAPVLLGAPGDLLSVHIPPNWPLCWHRVSTSTAASASPPNWPRRSSTTSWTSSW